MSGYRIQEISKVIDDMLAKIPTERDYNAGFGRIAVMLKEKHAITFQGVDLRIRFTLLMQEEFDSIPKQEWKVNDLEWLAEMEQKTKRKFLTWIGDQIQEKKEEEG